MYRQIIALLYDSIVKQYAQTFFSFLVPLIRPIGLIFVAFYVFDHKYIDYTIYVELLISTYQTSSSSFGGLKRYAFNIRLNPIVIYLFISIKTILGNIAPILIVIITLLFFNEHLSDNFFKYLLPIFGFSLALGFICGVFSVRYRDIKLFGAYLLSFLSLIIYVKKETLLEASWIFQSLSLAMINILISYFILKIVFYRVTEDF